MSTSVSSLTSESFITHQRLRGFGYTSKVMIIAGYDIAKSLRDAEQEFTLRPRVTQEVHLLKFRTVFTNREVIIRFNPNRGDNIVFRFIEHRDRFQCEGTTRLKVKEIQFNLDIPNLTRKITQAIHYEVMPWLMLGADNLRKPSIRMPVKRESIEAKSQFLAASFKVDHFTVAAGGEDTKLVLFSMNKKLMYAIPLQESLLERLQDSRSNMHLVVFANGKHLLVDESSFYREFIFIDEIEVTKPENTQQSTTTGK